ncbi:carboxymuconolactone decarboxylase family protein [Gordonia liuliyuniae]|uniref:Carboxymuconolactone decarboxylase family protein n=1 Tax=Gordonia liuliyuniae TaxID=2911517 RepID=A0ABS9IXT3_9ACTN|nr:carboxymuconolactone decarboxylase family protein [Gordonia liuliyuniae]MCF8590389.1 carboxymuconolactone decarboxylase family protein [Gordonia liuliyuniae]
MTARMTNPAMLLPGVYDALAAIQKAVADTGLPQDLCEMVNMRASQINGCSTCLDGHWRIARRLGVSDEKLFAVGAWHDMPYFTDAERIALELTEELTRLADNPEAVSDDLWDRAADEFDEAQLAALVVAIGNINLYNRVNHATRQPGGSWKP